jgi:hypothetical protein
MKSITIIGRKWFAKTYGNTYHSATILVDGKQVHNTGQHYGYGEQYLQTAWEWLKQHTTIPNDSAQPPWEYCEDNGITLHYSATDVPREKDL